MSLGIYPDKSDASWTRLRKDLLMRVELVIEPHIGGILWGSQEKDQPGSWNSICKVKKGQPGSQCINIQMDFLKK